MAELLLFGDDDSDSVEDLRSEETGKFEKDPCSGKLKQTRRILTHSFPRCC